MNNQLSVEKGEGGQKETWKSQLDSDMFPHAGVLDPWSQPGDRSGDYVYAGGARGWVEKSKHV